MFKEAMTHNEIVDLPIYALILFMAVFAIVAFNVWRGGKNNPDHARMAMMPLEDDLIVAAGHGTSEAAPTKGSERSENGKDPKIKGGTRNG